MAVVVGLLVLGGVSQAGAASLQVAGYVPFAESCLVQHVDPSGSCYIHLPDAPSVSASQTGAGSVEVSWTDPALTNDTIAGYSISWTGPESGNTTASSSSSSTTVNDLDPGAYEFTVRLDYATAPDGDPGTASVAVIAAPGEPTNLTATTGSTAETVELDWGAPATGGAPGGYRVYNGATLVTTTTGTSYTVTGLTTGQSYTFYVEAYNIAGTSTQATASATAG